MVSPVGEATSRCGSCGNDLRVKARFCDVCGSPVGLPAVAEYKQVTVLFVDVVGSMKLAAVLHPERLREIMNELFNRAAAVVQRYQGTLDKFTGDGLMALFGAPLALEDHALRACIAALEIQTVTQEFAVEVFRRDNVRLEVRVGLNSGEVITGSMGSGVGQYTAVGHPVGMAQRMESAAPPGGVLCSLSTARLVDGAAHLAPVEEVVIKGSDVPVPARRLLAVGSRQMVLGRNEGAMVGRDADLDRLQRIFETNSSHLVGVAGAAGLGKSRLIAELSAQAAAAGATIVLARCDAPTITVAFRAVSRLLRALFTVDGFSDADARARVLAKCNGSLAPGSGDAQILFDVMGIADADSPALQVSVDGRRRRLVEVMSQAVSARPDRLLFVLEDAHWIDAPSDEVLADFTAALTATQSMFVTTFRPEYRGALKQRAGETVTLQPLPDAMAVQLVCQLLGSDPLLAPLVDRIAVAAVGNPFFVEEIVRDLADRGVIAGSRGGYRLSGGVDEIGVPATVQAVLAARIDRLPSDAKAIVNAAAVIGNRFDVDTLHALLPDVMSSAMAELVSAEMIDQTEFIPRQRYCFRHPLVRTVAYESQLSATRAQAHRRLARAIEARDPTAGDENAALIATHLEAAGELVDAYRWHMRAAEWLRPRDMMAARTQWLSARRIADQFPDDRADAVSMRIAPRTMLISTALWVGSDADADSQYQELREMCLQLGDRESLAIATAGRIMSFIFNDDRVTEAASLASDLEEVLTGIEPAGFTAFDTVLISLFFARFACADFADALQKVDAIDARPHEKATLESTGVATLRGVVEICSGDYKDGRKHLAEGIAQARVLSPVGFAHHLICWGLVVALGLTSPDDLVDEMGDVLARAESFGDISGIIPTQFAYGIALLRSDKASYDAAVEVLETARAGIQKHRILTYLLSIIDADLAAESIRNGRQDNAIDQLRALYTLHISRGYRVVAGNAGEALVALLINRGASGDIAEAQRITNEWRLRRPGIPALDLWWLNSRAKIAQAMDDRASYTDLSRRYLSLCEKLDARGRLAEARRMVDRGG